MFTACRVSAHIHTHTQIWKAAVHNVWLSLRDGRIKGSVLEMMWTKTEQTAGQNTCKNMREKMRHLVDEHNPKCITNIYKQPEGALHSNGMRLKVKRGQNQERNPPVALVSVLHPAARSCRLLTQLDCIKQQTQILRIHGHHVGLQRRDTLKEERNRLEDWLCSACKMFKNLHKFLKKREKNKRCYIQVLSTCMCSPVVSVHRVYE